MPGSSLSLRPDQPSCYQAIKSDWAYNQACRMSHGIHVISIFITFNYLVEKAYDCVLALKCLPVLHYSVYLLDYSLESWIILWNFM